MTGGIRAESQERWEETDLEALEAGLEEARIPQKSNSCYFWVIPFVCVCFCYSHMA